MEQKNNIIAIGADHRGYDLKSELLNNSLFGQNKVTWRDVGTFSAERTDYPIFASKVVKLLKSGEADLGILACGSGIGIAVAANRVPGIYAGVVWQPEVARAAKEDDNVNILVLPADYITYPIARESIEKWLSATFKQGRYQERLSMIDND